MKIKKSATMAERKEAYRLFCGLQGVDYGHLTHFLTEVYVCVETSISYAYIETPYGDRQIDYKNAVQRFADLGITWEED